MAGFSVRPVPIEEYQSRIPVEEGLRRIIPHAEGISVGPALEQVGASLDAVAKSEAARYTLQTLSKTQVDWNQHLQEAQQNAAPGAPNFTADIGKAYNDYVQKAVKGAPTPLAGKLLQQHLTEFGTQLLDRSIRFEGEARQSHNVDTAQQAVDSAQPELQAHPELYAQRLAERHYLIDSMNIDPQAREKLHTYAQHQMSSFAVQGDIQRDPYKAMEQLTAAEPQGYYAHLSSQERDRLWGEGDRMLHQRVADAERIERIGKEQQEEASKNLLKQGMLLSQKGQLTSGWVISHSAVLEPQAMKFLLDESAGKNVQSDPHVYGDLLTRANHGEDVTDLALGSLYSGRLDKADFTRITDMAAKDTPNLFRQGDEKIRTALATSQYYPDPAKNQTLADARDDWINFMREHKGATQAEGEKEYNDIIRRYQLYSASADMLRLPVPEHFVGTRTAPDLAAWEASLRKDFQAGAINKQQLDREAAALHDWTIAVAAARQRAAAAKAKQEQQ